MIYSTLSYDEAHKIVESNRFLEWDGWSINTWRADPKGFSDVRGEFRDGQWCIIFRYPVKTDGTWSIPNSYVIHARKS